MAQETQSVEPSEPEAPAAEEPEHDTHAGHPSEIFYIKVAIALAIITAAEVATYYVEISGLALVTILVVMAAAKFALVVAFFMHLRFDNPIFRRLFITGVTLAIGVYLIVLSTFGVWTRS